MDNEIFFFFKESGDINSAKNGYSGSSRTS